MDVRFLIVGAPFLIAFFYTLFWLKRWGAFNSMNNNLPIICSKSHGCSQEILSNGKLGNIYNINDHYQLSNIIKKFIFNPNPFIKKAKLAKNSLSRFNLKKTVLSYEAIFDNL